MTSFLWIGKTQEAQLIFSTRELLIAKINFTNFPHLLYFHAITELLLCKPQFPHMVEAV